MAGRDVTLAPHSLGDLVTEVTRAYLHSGNPSALIWRLLEAVGKYRGETGEALSREDRAMLGYLDYQLRVAHAYLTREEDRLYPPCAAE